MKPMIANPIAVAMAIFWNSERNNIQRHCQFERKKKHFWKISYPLTKWSSHSVSGCFSVHRILLWEKGLPFLSGLVHLFTRRMESLTNILLGSTNCIIWSILVVICSGFLAETYIAKMEGELQRQIDASSSFISVNISYTGLDYSFRSVHYVHNDHNCEGKIE
jgi:hypothetical protein